MSEMEGVMKNVVRVIALLLVSTLVFSLDGTVSWTPPVEYVDGTPLLEQELDFYTLYCDDVVVATIDNVIGQRSAVVDMSALTEGSHTCALTVTALNGQESGYSNIVNFTVGPRVPGVPADLTIILQ
jgi:hypothetical protein